MIILIIIFLFVSSVALFNKVLPGLLSSLTLLIVYLLYKGTEIQLIIIHLGNAGLITLELGLLIIGSISFYRLLEHLGHFKDFSQRLQKQYRQVDLLLLMAWFLCTFFEGIAGFGVPALLIAPLMITLGYKPLSAVVLILSANTLSVCYGALGTPIKIGMNITSPDNPFAQELSKQLFPLMLIMPLFLLLIASFLEPQRIKRSWSMVPSALVAGLIPATVLYLFSSFSLEFPSVIAGLIGFIVYLIYRGGFSNLKSEMSYWFLFFKPYLMLVFVLFIARYAIGYANMEWISGLRKIAFYQPGLFILAFSFVWFLSQKTQQQAFNTYLSVLTASLRKSGLTLLTIFLLAILAGLMRAPVASLILNSGLNLDEITWLALLAGVLGSFTTGSLTMSNLLLHEAFETVLGHSGNLLQALVLLHIGGALGNAISLQNIIMADAVMPERAPLRKVMGYNLITVLFFLLLLLGIEIVG